MIEQLKLQALAESLRSKDVGENDTEVKAPGPRRGPSEVKMVGGVKAIEQSKL